MTPNNAHARPEGARGIKLEPVHVKPKDPAKTNATGRKYCDSYITKGKCNSNQSKNLHFCSVLKKNGKLCGAPTCCTGARTLRCPGPGGARRVWGDPLGARALPSQDFCDDFSDFEPDVGDEWRNWHMDDREWESDGDTEGNVRNKREKLPMLSAPPAPLLPAASAGRPQTHWNLSQVQRLLPAIMSTCRCQMRGLRRGLRLPTRSAAFVPRFPMVWPGADGGSCHSISCWTPVMMCQSQPASRWRTTFWRQPTPPCGPSIAVR